MAVCDALRYCDCYFNSGLETLDMFVLARRDRRRQGAKVHDMARIAEQNIAGKYVHGERG